MAGHWTMEQAPRRTARRLVPQTVKLQPMQRPSSCCRMLRGAGAAATHYSAKLPAKLVCIDLLYLLHMNAQIQVPAWPMAGRRTEPAPRQTARRLGPRKPRQQPMQQLRCCYRRTLRRRRQCGKCCTSACCPSCPGCTGTGSCQVGGCLSRSWPARTCYALA